LLLMETFEMPHSTLSCAPLTQQETVSHGQDAAIVAPTR
jgi:hypothetical protein